MQIRPATTNDATVACEVVRRSIIELCAADHDHDPEVLARWLASKTPGNMANWITRSDSSVLVAVEGEAVLAVGSVTDGGEITLNYVSPDARFRGLSHGMLIALEARARERGNDRCQLVSTLTAHAFYIARGYVGDGLPQCSFGKRRGSLPMSKAMTA